MNAKEIRKTILDKLYQDRSEPVVTVSDIQALFTPPLADNILHREIEYLDAKGLAEIRERTLDKKYLSFWGARITAEGIDLCEDPDSYGQLFSVNINNIGNVTNSNLAIGSTQSTQSITQQGISPEVMQLLEELKQALLAKEKDKAKSIFDRLLGFGENVAAQVIAAAITYYAGLK
jgi:hypothetical protein